MAMKDILNTFNKQKEVQAKNPTDRATAPNAVETEPSTCTSLAITGNALPQEVEPMAKTMFIGTMDDFDKAVETDITPRTSNIPELNREVRVITVARGIPIYAWGNDKESGEREVEFCQPYDNMTYSGTLKFSQADILMAAAPDDITDTETKKHAKRFITKAGREYLSKFRGNTYEILNMRDIVSALALHLPYIPVYPNDLSEAESVESYNKIVSIIKTLTSQAFNQHRAYYPITEDDLLYIARNMGLDKIGLLKKLRKHNFLYLTPSSRGYQTNVRMNGMGADSYTAWRYCILRNVELETNGDEYDGYDF